MDPAAQGARALAGAVAVEVAGFWQTGLRPAANAYGAMVYMSSLLNGQLAFAVLIMAGFTIARHVSGRLNAVRRVSFENTALLAWYTVGQALLGLLLVHGFPRLVG